MTPYGINTLNHGNTPKSQETSGVYTMSLTPLQNASYNSIKDGITTISNNASSPECPPLGFSFFFFFLAYRKPGFVVCGVSLSSLKPSRASGSGMWSKDEVLKHSGGDSEGFYFYYYIVFFLTRTTEVDVFMTMIYVASHS